LEQNVIMAAKDYSADLIVKLSTASACLSPKVQSGVGQAHRDIEKTLQASGINHVVLRANYFMVCLTPKLFIGLKYQSI
jgi:uncharacterized protein YbjT (DUF2867 family)